MGEKVDISKLIEAAQNASNKLEQAKEAEREASHSTTMAKNQAVKVWNSIYDHLHAVGEEYKNDEAYRDSKLSRLLNSEKVTKRVISE